MYPIGPLTDSGYRLRWITVHEAYKTWINSPRPCILHVHGISEISDASRDFFRVLDNGRDEKQKGQLVTYFTFKRNDDRFNSIAAMLSTLMFQIFSECEDLGNAVRLPFNEMSRHSSWTETEWKFLFRNMLSSPYHGGVVCVISNMEECESSGVSLLEDICRFARHTGRRFKIAVTSTTDCSLKSVLTDWPAINLEDHREDPNAFDRKIASDVDPEVLELVQHRKTFHGFEQRIAEKLSECGREIQWRHLVLKQLKFSKDTLTRLATEQQLDVLRPTRSNEIFVRILSEIPVGRRHWAREVLVWVLYSFHPLSVWELSAALMLQDKNLSVESENIDALVSLDITGELENVFKGIFVVEHNEVHLSHPDAREFFQNQDDAQTPAWYYVKDIAHQRITEACFFYLSLPQVQGSIQTSSSFLPTDQLPLPNYMPWNSLCSYAVKYWPRHYKLIPEKSRPTENFIGFCRNAKAMRLWTQTYWPLWRPIRRTDGDSSSMLPIWSGLGLKDQVNEWLDSETQTYHIEDCAIALAEAARNGEVEIVRALLRISGYSTSNLEDALIAASSTCHEAVLELLIKHTPQHCEDFHWPPVLLCQAALSGLEHVVKALLKHGASLKSAVTLHDLTPLHLAARHGHAEVVKVLLENEANVKARDKNGLTPLHTASEYSHAPVVNLLLDAHADCNAINNDEDTALVLACRNGSHMVVRRLLSEPECQIGFIRQGRWPALTVSSYFGFYRCAQLLLENHADTEIQELEIGTPLYHAALNGHLELCHLLLQHGANPNTLFAGNHVLSESASAGNLEIVKVLIKHGAELNATDSEDQNALQKASMKGDKALVAYLLDRGADVDHEDRNGCTSTIHAAHLGFAEIVQLLINGGADLEHHASNGWTPLHSCHSHVETTHVLLKNGADVNSVTKLGATPLFLAASSGAYDVVKALLSYMPDLELTLADGASALIGGIRAGNAEVVRLLLEAGANINRQSERKQFPLQFAVDRNMIDVLRVLMEYSPKLDLVDDDGDTALHCINSDTSIKIVKILVNAGINVNYRNRNRDTPICKAVWSNIPETLLYLAKKAKLDIVGGIRGGPLHIACYRTDLRLVKILVEAGADVNLSDPVAGTPLQIACRSLESSEEKQNTVIFYLINESKVNIDIVGGLHGCAINAACGRSSSEVVRTMLEKGTSIDVKDEMGRMAVHFAAARSMENFQAILGSGADVEVADKMGRTALHWASVSGMVHVVNCIVSLSSGLVNQGDLDGWTPLLWAARGSNTTQRKVSSSEQKEVIKLLLDRGADPCVRSRGLDREWSPVKVARYHGADSTVVQLLEEKAEEKANEKLETTKADSTSDEQVHTSRKADQKTACCDCCFAVGTSHSFTSFSSSTVPFQDSSRIIC